MFKKYSHNGVFVLLIATLLPILFGFIWLKSGLLQEPVGTVRQAVKLEFGVADVLPTHQDEQEWIIRTPEFDVLAEQLGEEGWEYIQQMGTGHFFEREGERMMVNCRMYSTRFQICEL